MSELLVQRAARLVAAAQQADWSGADPYDALWYPWPRRLVSGRRRRQTLIQLHARAPVDLRRLYRRSHPRIAKALALHAMAALRLAALGAGPSAGQTAARALSLIEADHSSGGPGWGYPFDVQTRWSYYPAHTPNVIVTSFAAIALAEGAEALVEAAFARRAREAALWTLDALRSPSRGFFVYHPGSSTLIHNANLLAARLCSRVLDDAPSLREALLDAIEPTLAAQRSDGAWPYGEGAGLEFIDSFHTGFVLEALVELRALDPRIPEAVQRGADYYAAHFFGPRGEARLWPQRRYPEDGHSAGTALSTLAALRALDAVPAELLERVAQRAALAMVRGDHALFRRYRWGASRVAYVRWCDGHMALGLANAASWTPPARSLSRPETSDRCSQPETSHLRTAAHLVPGDPR